ncbi:DGQHR domain-containing protein [Mesorhizobium sp. M2D.F.Ca.ET.223.01.1.1]|nr:DGQHR domain-containing protein [Mesorhizobium sp. M2D.F.Ca.ET.223.01.1.1]TGT78825.1 DGQHR domain-containing protein [bacterium M00.F.Ca.ET.159.01.1.1]TGT89491.1 DGQHR domain-containing protein [bacterium M00.F.Ca.ET.157.01.1.1]
MASIVIPCLKGLSAHRLVLTGFAPANLLHAHSFADILNEDTGEGYQRPFNAQHSQDFRRYIKEQGSSTIPLTLNLRPPADGRWYVKDVGSSVELVIESDAGKVMAQVDCQHRLGYLADLPISLPFMCFLGLSRQEEMEVFSIINSKAKGLSRSLLDYHEAQFAHDLAAERPELFIALHLNNSETSPWRRRLNLGGNTTSGLKRIVSLRMIQQAIHDFLRMTRILGDMPVQSAASTVESFWQAVASTMPDAWADPRRHMLTKGIGVYALTHIAADIYLETRDARCTCDSRTFAAALSDFVEKIDWTNGGSLKGYGGQGGVKAAVAYIREIRRRTKYKVIGG